MGTWFVGVDFGTVHTKVCIRESIDQQPSAVVVDDQKTGLDRYLIRSMPVGWQGPPPKVLLCGSASIAPELETRALHAAAQAVATALEAAVRQADAMDPSEKRLRLHLGLPTENGVMVDHARERYFLVAEAAIARIKDNRIDFSRDLFDERLASLAMLHLAKLELTDQPLMVVDGGGWTTHVSVLRWATTQSTPNVSIHGDSTAVHGVKTVVERVGGALSLEHDEAVEIIESSVSAAYRFTSGSQFDPSDAFCSVEVEKLYARSRQITDERAREELKVVSVALESFTRHQVLRQSWQTAWAGAYEASPSPKHFQKYWLVLTGGAARVGRDVTTVADDPLAASLSSWQKQTQIPFRRVIYPELDQSFWTFSPKPEPEVIPYLFVAGGYSFPHSDWPPSLARQVLRMQSTPRRMVPCNCGGIQPECLYCGGLGAIWEGTNDTGGNSQGGKGKRDVARTSSPDEICPVCYEVMPGFGSLAHFTSHVCSVCMNPVPDKREHLQKAHGWSKCGQCGTITDDLKKHTRRRHSRAPNAVFASTTVKIARGPVADPPPETAKPSVRVPAAEVSGKPIPDQERGWPPKVDRLMNEPSGGGKQDKKSQQGRDGPEGLRHNPFAMLKKKTPK